MKWVKCGLWVAAWGVWVWLGVGLYRELPRRFEPPIGVLPLDKESTIAGFIGLTNQVLVVFPEDRKGLTTLRVFDAESGSVVAESHGPSRSAYLSPESVRHDKQSIRLDPMRRERLFASELPYFGGRFWRKGLFVFDATTMNWQRVGEVPMFGGVVHHPDRPWLMFKQGTGWPPKEPRVVVYDYEAKRELFQHRLHSGEVVKPEAMFAPGDRVMIPIQRPYGRPEGLPLSTVEVWTVADPPQRLAEVHDQLIAPSYGRPTNGRLPFIGADACVQIFDATTARVIFARGRGEDIASARRRVGSMRPSMLESGGPVLSSSGRRLLGVMPPTLWDIDTGRAVWTPGSYEMAWDLGSSEQFEVVENWSNLWSRWLAKIDYTTHALRSLETGELCYRTADRVPIRPTNCNVFRSLAVADDGSIYRFPPPVNYPLLALCQTILALPLILIWAPLQYCRRRAARRQPVMALPSTMQP